MMSGLAMLTVLMSLAPGASAATTTGYAQWGPIAGTPNDYSTTMQLPALGFPRATLATDSRADVAIPTGASNWFGEGTPPGLRFGSSRDEAYINLRPRADNATSPSTSTYTFDRATPLGWAFVLGDIDADQVQVSATRADGTPATTAELGFRSTFNLCATTPRPSSVCSTTTGRPQDVPTWDPATATLRGNAGAVDSDGATGWFEPTTSLRTLTFTFTRRAGFPVFQTWFAVTKQDVRSTVTVDAGSTCALTGATVALLDRSGATIQESPITSGDYSFLGVAASDGYRVVLNGLPDTCIVNGSTSRAVDLRTGDALVSFTVREIIPFPISGEVSDGTDPVEGVTVTLTPDGGGAAKTTTTDVDGRYVFDDNPDDTDYTIEVTPPAGYEPVPDRQTSIDGGPVTEDFVLQALPIVSGTVSDADGPVAGVTVELADGAQTYRAVTAANGTYELPGVPAGTYALTVPSPPAGYQRPAPTATVVVAGADRPNQDILLTRVPATGSVAGTVTLDGAPLAGVDVAVRPTGGTGGTGTTVTTDAEGTYGLGGLAPGTYEIVVTPPPGTTGTSSLTVTVPAGGAVIVAQDFALTRVVAPVPTPDPDPDDDGTSPDDDSDDSGTAPDDSGTEPDSVAGLPDAGGPAAKIPLTGLALVLVGSAAVVAARPRRS
ncbi:MAG: carboxypeptidase regulatory-like domain-containing protein [Aeromicrobium sp.]